jgi:protein SCO1/2
LPEDCGIDAHGGLEQDLGDLFAVGGSDHGVQVVLLVDTMTKGAERKLATTAEGGEDGALGGDGELGCGIVERADGVEDEGVVPGIRAGGVERAGFEAEGSLAGRGGELVDGEALVDAFGAAEAIEAGGGEDEGVALAFAPLAEAGVDVAAHGDELEIRTKGEEHGPAAGAGGGDAAAEGEHVEAPELFADEGVAGVGAGWDGGEGEAGVELGGQVFERVDGQVDAGGGEGFLNLLDEDAFAVADGGAVGVGGRGLEGWVLHAVAEGADDFDFDGVAVFPEACGDVVCLPEGELRAAGPDADGVGSHRSQGYAGRRMDFRRDYDEGMRCVKGVCCLMVVAAMAATAAAQGYDADKPMGSSAQQVPAYLAHAGLEQRLGESLPMSAPYTDETGRSGALGSWFAGKPVVMAEVYYRCAMLCPQVLHGLAIGLKAATLKPGKDYDVVVLSIDPMDTPADAANEKRDFLAQAGWSGNAAAAGAVHFLTGPQASIDATSEASGFHFVRVPGPDGKMDQFAHSSVILFATPEGKLSKYLAGIDYPPRDVRLALLEAGEKKISNPVDLLILYCCNYSPSEGMYTVSVLRVLGLAGVASIGAMVGMIFLLSRKPKGAAA